MAATTTSAPPVYTLDGEIYTDAEHLIGGRHNLATIGDKVGAVALGEAPTPKGWWIMFLIGFTLLQGLVISLGYLFYVGLSIWGINQPV
ncbi:MAG: hypothetical protein ACRCZF_13995, partial [Gemmataceae bacterium]